MKCLAFAVLLSSLIPAAAESLMPTAEGTTWKYDLIQEKISDSLDLKKPSERGKISRLAGPLRANRADARDHRSVVCSGHRFRKSRDRCERSIGCSGTTDLA